MNNTSAAPSSMLGGARRSKSVLRDIRERYERSVRDDTAERAKQEERKRIQQFTYSELVDFLHPPESPAPAPGKAAPQKKTVGGVVGTFRESRNELDLSGALAQRKVEASTTAVNDTTMQNTSVVRDASQAQPQAQNQIKATASAAVTAAAAAVLASQAGGQAAHAVHVSPS